MDKVVFDILCWVSFSWGSDIAFFEEIYVHWFCQQRPYSYIEFAIMDKEWPFNIFLDYEWAGIEFELFWNKLRLIAIKVSWLWLRLLFWELFWRGNLFLFLTLTFFFTLILIFIFLLLFLSFFFLSHFISDLFSIHEYQIIWQDFLKLFKRIKNLNSSTSIESCWFE